MHRRWGLLGVLIITAMLPARLLNRKYILNNPGSATAPHEKASWARVSPVEIPGNPIPSGEEHNTESYAHYQDNAFLTVARNPLSTFSIDVDTASYSNVRRFLNEGKPPPKDAVRIAELVNYFDYAYPEPQGDHPVGMAVDGGPCPWNERHKLVRIALKAKAFTAENMPPRNLVFLVDVSGSMDDPLRLPLVKASLRLLVERLTARDRFFPGQSEPEAKRGRDPRALASLRARIGLRAARGITIGNMHIQRSTPEGEHRPVILNEVLSALDPRPGDVVVDCTLGFGGHAVELLKCVGPNGKLIGFDLDAGNLPAVEKRLREVGHPFSLHHGNFAGLARILGEESPEGCDCLLADLGMSSMQVDDAARGFSFMRDGPLDMRMDPSRGRTASELLMTLPAVELAAAFRELGDEPEAEKIAAAIVEARAQHPITNTRQLAKLIQEAAPVKISTLPGAGKPWQQRIRPTARVFQALRILVNRELANLQELLRVLPWCLKPGGRAAIISFHSGEDRLVKAAFKEGLRTGAFEAISDEPIRATYEERGVNPRSRSAKLRWARRAVSG